MTARPAAPGHGRLPAVHPVTGTGRLGPSDVLVVPGPDDPLAVDVARRGGVDLPARVRRAQEREGGSPPRAAAGGDPLWAVELDGPGPGLLLVLRRPAADADAAWASRAGAAVAARGRGRGRTVVTGLAGAPAGHVRAFVEGLLLASYTFSRRSARPGPPPAGVDVVLGDDAPRAAVGRAVATARATCLARDLANAPGNEKSPAWLADQAVRVAEEGGLAARVHDEHDLARGGFGGLLAVGAGSARPPRLVELSYVPRWRGSVRDHVVLVGKGITFDSGGISIKPADGMASMKTDMSGAAAVLAAMSALRVLRVPVRVTGLLACAENLPGGAAMRPGDVVRHPGGRTTEVLNTDAEGRLVLADALDDAARRLRPDVLVDVATLTGAATRALGRRQGALFATTGALADALVEAGRAAGEPVWPMPLVEDYAAALDSATADAANVALDREVGAGAVLAALFLRPFAHGRPWAHLDIAGPARADAPVDHVTRGGTGFGARLLLRWLEAGAPR